MDTASPPTSNTVSAGLLRGVVERLERVAEEKQACSDRAKEIMAEAKANGLEPRYITAIVKLRKMPPSEREEAEAMLEMYSAALGMSREAPLFRHVQGMGVDVAVREHVLEALKLLAPADGEITIRVPGAPRMRIFRDRDGVHAEEVKETPPAEKPAPAGAPSATAKREVPDCTLDEAFDLGRQARKDDEPVVANPFPWDDKRRRRWDEGWREQDGGDGMGPR